MDTTRTRPVPGQLDVHQLGRISYEAALELQQRYTAEIQRGERSDTLLFVEHDPVITLGSAANAGDVVATDTQLTREGVAVHRTDRGGAATYHGPGQLVGYPLVDLRRRAQPDLGGYLRSLERALVATLATYEIDAWSPDDNTGVWCDDGKIAAIGVRVRHWVTSHGFALNVDPNLDHFRLLVPCAEPSAAVTSMEQHGVTATLEDVARVFAREWSARWLRETND